MHIEIPGSGSIMPPTWSHVIEVDGLMGLCRWIWEITNEAEDNQDVQGGDGSLLPGWFLKPEGRPRTANPANWMTRWGYGS